MQRFGLWIFASAAIAGFAFAIGPLRWILSDRGNDVPLADSLFVSVWVGWIWIATFVGAIWTARWKALWLLLAAPFALYWPMMWIFVAGACNILGNCW
jgi:hypothetical protein